MTTAKDPTRQVHLYWLHITLRPSAHDPYLLKKWMLAHSDTFYEWWYCSPSQGMTTTSCQGDAERQSKDGISCNCASIGYIHDPLYVRRSVWRVVYIVSRVHPRDGLVLLPKTKPCLVCPYQMYMYYQCVDNMSGSSITHTSHTSQLQRLVSSFSNE